MCNTYYSDAFHIRKLNHRCKQLKAICTTKINVFVRIVSGLVPYIMLSTRERKATTTIVDFPGAIGVNVTVLSLVYTPTGKYVGQGTEYLD